MSTPGELYTESPVVVGSGLKPSLDSRSATMRLQRGVTCWTSHEHQIMLGMSIIGILIYMVV